MSQEPTRRAGGLLVDKPAGPTSHDVVNAVRRLARERRCGHSGTLDPFATGLLVVLVGRATRLARFLSGVSKSYVAGIRFGFATDTYDATGYPIGPLTDDAPEREELEQALRGFVGAKRQSPPPFSAKRIGGERAYRLARRGLAVAPAAIDVEIHEIRLIDFRPPSARIEVSVSSGTYIRSLAHDLGRTLGPGAHLETLRRTRVGSFRVEDALGLDALSELAASGGLEDRLVSPEEVLRDLPVLRVDGAVAAKLVHGRPLSLSEAAPEEPPRGGGPFRVLGPEGKLVAVAEPVPGTELLRPLVVWARP